MPVLWQRYGGGGRWGGVYGAAPVPAVKFAFIQGAGKNRKAIIITARRRVQLPDAQFVGGAR